MPGSDWNTAFSDMRQSILTQEALQRLAGALALGTGAGLALRGAQGMATNIRRNLSKPKNQGALRPYIVEIKRDKEKQAFVTTKDVSNFIQGSKAENVYGLPWFLPAAGVALAGSGYGSYKALDYLLDRNRKKMLDSELTKAKQEYEDALTGNVKTASENTLAYDLDVLASRVMEAKEKFASEKSASAGNLAGTATGIYLLAALGGGGYIGLNAYNAARKNSRRRLLEKARKQLNRTNVSAPLYAELEDSSEEPLD